jgi:hypothetical protein
MYFRNFQKADIKIVNGRYFFVLRDIDVILTPSFMKSPALQNVL